jgi:hypothetical protein
MLSRIPVVLTLFLLFLAAVTRSNNVTSSRYRVDGPMVQRLAATLLYGR